MCVWRCNGFTKDIFAEDSSVLWNAGDRLYVQVAYMMSSKETRDREFGALEAIPDQFEKVVLSMDKVDFSRNGICHMDIPDVMLTPGY